MKTSKLDGSNQALSCTRANTVKCERDSSTHAATQRVDWKLSIHIIKQTAIIH